MNDNSVQMYPLEDLQKIRGNFIQELLNASDGKKTSLSFVKNPLPKKSFAKDGEIFQVMVVGGSKFESALLKKIGKSLQIITYNESRVPLFKTKEYFFSFLEKHLDRDVTLVALNFAFSLKPILRDGILDGIRSGRSGKEHAFAGLYGQTVGAQFEKYIYESQKRSIIISCANDTICLLLSGLDIGKRNLTVAGIVGTGVNFAFFLDEKTTVNLESGSFDKFRQTPIGKQVDKSSLRPGKALFEKEVAGAYLYKHFNLILRQIGLIGQISPLQSSEELSSLAIKNLGESSWLARQLLERSASLVVCQMAGIYFYKKNLYGQTNDLSLQYILEGSLFWNGWNYKKMVEKYLYLLDVPKNDIKFVQINQSGIIGAAQLLIGQA